MYPLLKPTLLGLSAVGKEFVTRGRGEELPGFGCVRQPGLCRTWNTFQLLWVPKELRNYFDTNLLWEKDELMLHIN